MKIKADIFVKVFRPKYRTVLLSLLIVALSHLAYYTLNSFFLNYRFQMGLPIYLDILLGLFYSPGWIVFGYFQKLCVYSVSVFYYYIHLSVVLFLWDSLQNRNMRKAKRIALVTFAYLILTVIMGFPRFYAVVRVSEIPLPKEVKLMVMLPLKNNCRSPFSVSCKDCRGFMLPGLCIGKTYYRFDMGPL